MKKIICTFLFLMLVVASVVYSADWSKYESGRNNISLDGYNEQPGYIAFGDGTGTTLGYMWMSTGQGLVWCSATTGTSYEPLDNSAGGSDIGAINLDNTKLTNDYGVRISSAYNGGIIGKDY